ncbi:hypothetical protein [Halorussus salinus]|uniref:hypothetical protein n=1 Tax=Halorussus salinus TaxID=1364935 RepID=UPI001091B4FA|nr:hypothetical protein [Halorussus salinus]
MDRREFLASGATLAIATAGGCTGCARAPATSLRLEPISDYEIAREVTYGLEGSSDRRELVADAVENGSAAREATEPPFPENRSFVYRDSVYRLSREVVETTDATTFHFTLNPADGSVSESETVRFEELPAVDRETFADRGWADDPFLGFGSSLLYLDSEIPDSALVPDPDRSVIVWDPETKGRFEVDDSYEDDLKEYRYESEEVHSSAEQFGAEVREEYAFELSDLSEAEREILDEAIVPDDYSVPADENPPDAALKLATRFRPHDEVRYAWEESDEGAGDADAGDEGADESGGTGRIDGIYLLRYDGEVYWTSVQVARDLVTTTES